MWNREVWWFTLRHTFPAYFPTKRGLICCDITTIMSRKISLHMLWTFLPLLPRSQLLTPLLSMESDRRKNSFSSVCGHSRQDLNHFFFDCPASDPPRKAFLVFPDFAWSSYLVVWAVGLAEFLLSPILRIGSSSTTTTSGDICEMSPINSISKEQRTCLKVAAYLRYLFDIFSDFQV